MFFKLKIVFNLIRLKIAKKRYKNRLSILQARKWKKLNGTLEKSPFYRDLALKDADLKEYPVINKSNFMDHFDNINTRQIKRNNAFKVALKAEQLRDFSPMIENITVGLSSGTSGNRGIFLASEEERAMWVACVLDRVIGFSLRKRTVAFFLRANSNLYDSVKSRVLQFEFFDLLTPIEGHINRLNKLNPTILVAQPSLLLELADQAEKGRLRISPQKIISVAEVLYPEDKIYLEKVFDQKIHQVYQCTEGLLGATCVEGTLHFNEDLLIIERKYLDREKVRFHPIITDLMRKTQPVIRYELNDIIHEKKECPCGSSMLAIEKIEGRSDDVLIFKSKEGSTVKIFPDFFRRAIILSNEKIKDYALLQTASRELKLYLDGPNTLFDDARHAINNLLTSHNIEDMDILRIEKRPHEIGNKFRRIRNDNQQTS